MQESQPRGLGTVSSPQVKLPTDHPHKALFIGQIMGYEVKHLFTSMAVWSELPSMLLCFYIFKETGLSEPTSPPGSHAQGSAQPGAGGNVRQDLYLLMSRTEGPVLTWRPDNIFLFFFSDNIFQITSLPRSFMQQEPHKQHSLACLDP